MDESEMPISSFTGTARGMSRPSKIFIKVDREGLLTDTIAISDVVNFDCYESIVTSAQRIIACFQSTKADNIDIKSLYYYKKRARSSRMNPVPIFNTTDGFRAVAEHPNGEVPLGVLWTRKSFINKEEKRPNTKQAIEIEKIAHAGLQPTVSPNPDSNLEIPEKRRRTESPGYKTYMPVDGTQAASQYQPPISRSPNAASHIRGSPTPPPPPVYSSKININSNVLHNLPKVVNPTVVKERDYDEDKSTGDQAKYPHKSHYQWPSGVSCEVILSYDGISERKTLSPGVSFVVQNLVKGNYGVLNRELQLSLSANKMSSKTAQEVISEINHTTPPPPNGNGATEKVPIAYLQDAKTEIFKILSLLSLSKARFQKLLEWMRSLKLEEGKQGKFYLSERNIIAGGLRVNYDTDEQAAMRLSHIYKTRSRSQPVKVLHPIHDSSSRPPAAYSSGTNNMSVSEPPPNQIMFLMPQSSLPVTTTTSNHLHASSGNQQLNTRKLAPQYQPVTFTGAGTSLLPPNMQNNPNNTRNMQQIVTSQGIVEVVPITQNSIPSPVPPKIEPVDRTDGSLWESASHTVPSILRRKQKHPTHKLRSLPSPVPMHLYRSYPTDTDPSNVKLSIFNDSSEVEEPVAHIKQEPDEYGESSDATEDYDQTSEKESSPGPEYCNRSKNYSDVLKSDVKMPQTTEQNDKPFELVIKSEPVDDGY